jgi:hypothetical protein
VLGEQPAREIVAVGDAGHLDDHVEGAARELEHDRSDRSVSRPEYLGLEVIQCPRPLCHPVQAGRQQC